MMNWIDELFKVYEPLKHSFDGNNLAYLMNAIGGIMMAIAFLTLGGICIGMAGKSYPPTQARKLSVIYFGWFLISCGVVRGLDMTAYWYNLATIRGIFKVIAGLSFLRIILLMPKVIKQTLEYKTLRDVEEQLKKTTEKLEEVKILASEITDKTNGK